MRALRDFVLAPPRAELALPIDVRAPADTPATAPRAPAAASLAVLCAAADARALGVAAAVALARRHRAGCALTCIWTAPEPHRHPEARPPTTRAARRLAASLAARGLDAMGCGRAVAVALTADPVAAAAAVTRAHAAAGDAPSVLVLGGPRDDTFDSLLADRDAVLLLGRTERDAAVADLARAGLGPQAAVATVALGPLARAMAAAGLVVPAALRRAIAREDTE